MIFNAERLVFLAIGITLLCMKLWDQVNLQLQWSLSVPLLVSIFHVIEILHFFYLSSWNPNTCREGILSTPAVSAVIRKRKASLFICILLKGSRSFFYNSSYWWLFSQANGGFIMSASHNPGGPEYDWGIKVKYLCISFL